MMKIEVNEKVIAYVHFEDLKPGTLFMFGPDEPLTEVYIKMKKCRLYSGCDGYALKLSDGDALGIAKEAKVIEIDGKLLINKP